MLSSNGVFRTASSYGPGLPHGSRGEAFHLLTAAAFVSMVIPMVVFLSLQRYFVRGLLAGSVKG